MGEYAHCLLRNAVSVSGNPLGVGWVNYFQLRMNPVSTRICVPNLVAVRRSCRKRGGGYRQTDSRTKGNCSFIYYIRVYAKYCYSKCIIGGLRSNPYGLPCSITDVFLSLNSSPHFMRSISTPISQLCDTYIVYVVFVS